MDTVITLAAVCIDRNIDGLTLETYDDQARRDLALLAGITGVTALEWAHVIGFLDRTALTPTAVVH